MFIQVLILLLLIVSFESIGSIMSVDCQFARYTYSAGARQQIRNWANTGSASTQHVVRELASNGRSSSTPGYGR